MSNEGYSLVYNTIKEHMENNPLVNEFGEGMGDEIDLSKQTIFPLKLYGNGDGNARRKRGTIYVYIIRNGYSRHFRRRRKQQTFGYEYAIQCFVEVVRRVKTRGPMGQQNTISWF